MKTHSRFTRIAIASGLIVASGAAVLGITGFASAELAGNNDQAAVVAPAAGSADDTDVANAQSVEGVAPAHDGGPRASVSAVNVAKVLGLTEEELRTELQTKSFVTIAGEKKVDIAKVKEALTADAKAHLDAEVASGEHTQAEADARLAAFTANLDAFVNAVRPAKGMGGRHGGAPFATEGLAKVYGISVTELQTELQTKSLAALATEKKVDIADVKAQLLADFTAKEQAEVTSGDHTQAEVDAKIAAFKANLDSMVNNVRPAGGPDVGGKGMGGRHGGRHGHGDHGGMGGEPGATADDAAFSA